MTSDKKPHCCPPQETAKPVLKTSRGVLPLGRAGTASTRLEKAKNNRISKGGSQLSPISHGARLRLLAEQHHIRARERLLSLQSDFSPLSCSASGSFPPSRLALAAFSFS